MSLCAIKNNLVKSSQTVYIYISVPCHFNVSTWWRPIFLHFYWPEKLKRTFFFFSFGNAFIVTTAYIYMVWRWVKSRNEMIYSISLVCLVWFSFRSDCIHRVHTECRWWPWAKGAPLKTFDSSDSWHSLSLSFFFLLLWVHICVWIFVCEWEDTGWIYWISPQLMAQIWSFLVSNNMNTLHICQVERSFLLLRTF